MTKLDIISDVICPWCYIGKTKLDRALQAKPDHGLVIEWHPYMLNPDMPAEGMDRREYLELKFGGKQGATDVYSSIAQAAEEAGLEVRFDLIQRTPSTLDAHRLIHWAGLEGVQVAVVSTLFHAYFRDGLDISDHGVLTDIAASCGMGRAVITKLLAQDADIDDIRKRARNAAARGVRGVPCFIIDNHYVVQGAQPADLWEKVIDDIAAQAGAARS
ncbi:MAG: DsbA family oxidoreductase [Rhodobacteraceae bacterium]|nr:DsbA family oxidoreductase [Paracoccaceae bacterium]